MPKECGREGCGREIDWATTKNENQMPVDHDSVNAEDGDLAVWRDERTGELRCRHLKTKAGVRVEDPVPPHEHLGRNHWRTCTNPPQRRG
jgi:hypothetical protein